MTPSELVDLAERLRAMRAQHLAIGEDHIKQADLLDRSIRWLDQHVTQLTSKTSTVPETPPAPPCFWCGYEKNHPDHKFGAGKNHAYRVGSVVTKEERESYALNR